MATLIEGFPLISTLRDAVFLTATVSEIEALTPRMRRIRFSGPRLHGLGWTPGQHVRLQVESLRQSVLRLHPYPCCARIPSTPPTPTAARWTS